MTKHLRSFLVALAAGMGLLTTAQTLDGYYNIKNSGNGKYIEVRGRRTAVPNVTDVTGKPGAIIKVKAENGKITELRSQGVDPTAYAQKAMKYVPDIVNVIVEKFGLTGSGQILGHEGLDKIMDKFEANVDVNLYLKTAGDGYRIYGKTPSMAPIKEFYEENKNKADAKLPSLEQAINDAIAKVVDRLGKGASLKNTFKLSTIWQRMKKAGINIPEPTEDNVMDFYHAVFEDETNIWQFAYQTATFYMEFVEGKGQFQEMMAEYPEYSKYWDLVKKIRPDFKYYIVEKDGTLDIISEGNVDIKNNAARTIWILEDAASFNLTAAVEKEIKGVKYYYTTLYVDFPYNLPEGVKAFYVSDINSKGYAVTSEITGTVPAQTPVVLESEGKADIALVPTTSTAKAPTDNMLHGNDFLINLFQIKTQQVAELFNTVNTLLNGTHLLDNYEHLQLKNSGTINNKYFFNLTETDLEDPDYGVLRTEIDNGNVRVFTLNPNTNKIGFYKYKKGLNGNKAFLYIDNEASGSKVFNMLDIDEDTATAIESINANDKVDNTVYDLQGRKVARPFNGVFIINGKKVLMK